MRGAIGFVLLCLVADPAPAAYVADSRLFAAHAVRGAFLARGLGARAVGMGEAFVAVADDSTAASWNPGGLGQLDALSAVAMYDFAGHGLSLSHVSLAAPIGPGVAGAGISVLSYGDYEMRDAGGLKLGTEDLLDLGVAAAFAFENPSWLGARSWTGVSVDLVREAVGGSLLGLSLGAMAAVSPRLKAALTARHVGPSREGGSLPASVHGGAAYVALDDLNLAIDAGYGLVDGEVSLAGGGELAVHEAVVLRGGYRWTSISGGWRGLDGVTFGFGVRLAVFGFDYACRPFGDFATTHKVSLVYAGEPKPVRVGADALHAQAAALYSQGLYAAALGKARAALKENPLLWRTWGVAGNCLYRQDDIDGALEAYGRSLEINPDNPELASWMEKLKPRARRF